MAGDRGAPARRRFSQPALAAPALVDCTGDRVTSGSAFTPGSFYSYTLDAAADVPALLRQYAGPQANIGV
jgi:pectate lyase